MRIHVQTYMFLNLGKIHFYSSHFSAELIKTLCLSLKCVRQAGHDEHHLDKKKALAHKSQLLSSLREEQRKREMNNYI